MDLPDDVNDALTTLSTSGYIREAKAFIDYITVLERELGVAKEERDRYRKERRELLKLYEPTEALTR